MDFKDTPEEAAFRTEVRDFLTKEMPDRFKTAPGERMGGGGGDIRSRFEQMKEWRTKLADKGWIAPAWPTEYGGAGLGTMQQFIMNEEFAENRAMNVGGMGTSMIGPTIIIHGSEEQKKEHLGRILSGEVQWCQGFSEPESGSDLASLQTRAVRDGDDYVINGQKIWTSFGHYADCGALASKQSRPLSDRTHLEGRFRELEEEHRGAEIPYPGFWGGYRLVPLEIEFWQGRPDRLHDRLLFERGSEGEPWTNSRLQP